MQQLNYIIGITPRVGNTHFASILSGTNLLGHPYECGALNAEAFQNHVERCRSSNGVSGFTIAYANFLVVREHYDFTDTHFIWLRRKNTIRQAISWLKADKSGIWHVKDQSYYCEEDQTEKPYVPPNVNISMGEINRTIGWLHTHDLLWHDYLIKSNIDPHLLFGMRI